MLSMMLQTLEVEKRLRFYEEFDDAGNAKGWYYHTREGVLGPFASLAEAEMDLEERMTRREQERMIG